MVVAVAVVVENVDALTSHPVVVVHVLVVTVLTKVTVSVPVTEKVVTRDICSVQTGTAEPLVQVKDVEEADVVVVESTDVESVGLFSLSNLSSCFPRSSKVSVRLSTMSMGGDIALTVTNKLSTTLVAQATTEGKSIKLSMIPEIKLRRYAGLFVLNSALFLFKLEHSGFAFGGSGIL